MASIMMSATSVYCPSTIYCYNIILEDIPPTVVGFRNATEPIAHYLLPEISVWT